MELEEILKKAQLVQSDVYAEIKRRQIEHIIDLSNTAIDPIILKGMLKNIYDTDKWEEEFYKAKREMMKDKEQ